MRPEPRGQRVESFRGVLLLALIASLAAASTAVEASGSETPSTVSGGHAILLEAYTASWCDICEDVDPRVDAFVDDASGRVYRIALHPNDTDPMGQQLTSERLFRHGNPAEIPLPTLWFDGEELGSGDIPAWQLSQALLGAEAARQSSSQMELTVSESNGQLGIAIDLESTELTGTSLSIYLKSAEETHGRAYHDVVTEHVQISLDSGVVTRAGEANVTIDAWSQTGHSAELELKIRDIDIPEDFEVVVVHESAERTMGVLGLERGPTTSDAPAPAILVLATLTLGTALILPKGKNR